VQVEVHVIGYREPRPQARPSHSAQVVAAAGATDAELAGRALEGDGAAFAQLMAHHKLWVLRFIRRYVGNVEDAHDLLQDTFVSAWLALARYEQDRPFDSWLRRIALNKCRDRSRRESVRRALRGSLDADQTSENVDDAANPETLTQSDEALTHLELALRDLPQHLSEPLRLTALEGLSHEEAGELLGISGKAVEMRMYRIRRRLAGFYAPHPPPRHAQLATQMASLHC
jgi:RNA polymerase sigma-70 factor (ECF subfamily)